MDNRKCQKCGGGFAVPYPTTKRKQCYSCRPRRNQRAVRSDKGIRKVQYLKVRCVVCGVEFEKQPYQASRVTDHLCGMECRAKLFATGVYARKVTGTHKKHDTRTNVQGYAWIYLKPEDRPPGWKNPRYPEHRWVMSRILGRHLLPGENVHHVNGQRDDNRPENLELWMEHGSQPKGSRVVDMLAWMRETLARYEGIEDKLQ